MYQVVETVVDCVELVVDVLPVAVAPDVLPLDVVDDEVVEVAVVDVGVVELDVVEVVVVELVVVVPPVDVVIDAVLVVEVDGATMLIPTAFASFPALRSGGDVFTVAMM